MPKLPKAREVEKVLRSLKFLRYQLSRQSGSYAMHKNSEGKIIVPPVHGGREISVSVFGGDS